MPDVDAWAGSADPFAAIAAIGGAAPASDQFAGKPDPFAAINAAEAAKPAAYGGTTAGKAAALAGSGLSQGLIGVLGAPVDLVQGAMNVGQRVNKALGLASLPPPTEPPFGGSESISRAFAALDPRLDPANPAVQPQNELERLIKGGSEGVGAAVAPIGVAAALGDKAAAVAAPYIGGGSDASLAANAGIGGMSGAGGQGAADAVPDKWKPLAATVGAFLVPATAVGGGMVAAKTAEAAWNAIPAITDASKTAAARAQVGQEMNLAATDRGAAMSNLESQPAEIIPGSQGTTGQVAGDAGLLGYEKGVAQSPEGAAALAQRGTAQNNARQAALATVQPQGNVADLPEAVWTNAATADAGAQTAVQAAQNAAATHSAAVDTRTAAQVAEAQQAHQEALANLQSLPADASPLATAAYFRQMRDVMEMEGAQRSAGASQTASTALAAAAPAAQTPEQVGAALREPAQVARETAASNANALYAALPKDMVAPTTDIAAKAKAIQAGMLPEHSPIVGEEARLLGLASSYGDQTPLANVNALRGSILSARSVLKRSDPQAYGRLGQLQQTVEGSVDHAVENRAALDNIAVRRGTMAPENALPGRLSKAFDDVNTGQNATVASGGSRVGPGAGRSESGNAGVSGSGGAENVGPGNAAGAQGVSPASRGIANRAGEIVEPAGRKLAVPAPKPGTAPTRLLKFLAAGGGLRPDPELKAIFDKENPFIPGVGRLIRPNGKSLDYAREAAIEAGYIDDPGFRGNGPAESTVSDLLDKISSDYSGDHQFPIGDDTEEYKSAIEARQLEGAIRAELRGHGINPNKIDRTVLNHTIDLVASHEQTNIPLAYERAVMQHREAREAVAAARIKDTGPLHGYDVSDDSYGAPPREFAPLGNEQTRSGGSGEIGADVGREFGTRKNDRGGGGEGNSQIAPGAPQVANGPGTSTPLRQANAAYRNLKQTFDEGPVGDILAKTGRGQPDLSNAEVAAKVFHAKPTAGEDVRAYLKAAGDKGVPAVSDAAAFSLHEAATNADGTFNTAKATKWIDDHKLALNELPPEVRARFQNATDAHHAVTDLVAKQRENMGAFDKSEAGKVAGLSADGDIVKHVGSIVDSKTAPEARLGELATAAKGNPAATEGLKRAAIEHVLGKFVPEGGNPQTEKLQSYLADKKDVLGKVLSPGEVADLGAKAEAATGAKGAAESAVASRAEALKGAAASGKQIVSAAEQGRADALSKYDRGVLGQLKGVRTSGDVLNVIKGIFGAKDGAAKMQALAAEAAAHDKATGGTTATDALKRAVQEHIQREYSSTTEAGTSGVLEQKRAGLASFMKTKTDALKASGLSDEQIGLLRAVTEDGLRANRSISVVKAKGGSDTSANRELAAKMGRASGGSMLGGIAIESGLAAAGHAVGGIPGLFIGKYLGDKVLASLREAGLSKVKALRVEAVLNPEVGHSLMREFPLKPNSGTAANLALRARQIGLSSTLAGMRQMQ